jgi:hypothetical protein
MGEKMKATEMTVEQFKSELQALNKRTLFFEKAIWNGNRFKSTKYVGKQKPLKTHWKMV